MPVRTVTQEFCDVCFQEQNGREVLSTDTLRFGWQGKSYVLLVCGNHVDAIRDELQRLSDLATIEASSSSARRTSRLAGSSSTLLSQLTPDEKHRFLKSVGMPTARRVADQKVQTWIDLGKP